MHFSEDVEMIPLSTENKTFTAFNITNHKNENTTPSSILTELKDRTASSINKIAGENIVATSQNTTVFPIKSRLIQFAASVVGNISNHHVKVKTTFDPFSGELAAYEVEMGRNKWQKQY